jgi:hypothetical protein
MAEKDKKIEKGIKERKYKKIKKNSNKINERKTNIKSKYRHIISTGQIAIFIFEVTVHKRRVSARSRRHS